MDLVKDFDINLFSLSNKVYDFSYEIDNKFFGEFENSPVESGKLEVKVILDKGPTMIVAEFSIDGIINLTCDKSLREFERPLTIKDRYIFKFGDEFQEIGESLFTIPHDESIFNIAPYVFEMIAVEIPYRNVHPDYEEEYVAEDDDEDDYIYISDEDDDEEDEEEDNNTDDNDDVDPRWSALKNLKTDKSK